MRKTIHRASLWIVVALIVAAGSLFFFRNRAANQSPLKFSSKPNVILITIDTTRADHLHPYGYEGVRTPNLDSLAKRGILFRQCATAAPLTLPSHCSIMTGTYPTYHGVRINGNTALATDHLTIAEAFASHGYETSAFVAAFVLDGRWGLNQGFHHYDDQFDLKKFKKLDLGLVQRPGNQVVDAALTWLESHKEKPFFSWIHLYDPHMPYAPPEPYKSQYESKGITGLYDGEIAFMDEQIGRVMDWLDRRHLRDRTVIAVVGDHGEGLGDHGEMTHGYFIYDYAVHVPLIVSTPAKSTRGLVIESQVRTIDMYPTLLQAAEISIPKQVQGTSLLPLIERRGKGGERLFAYSESMSPSIQYGWSPLLSLRTAQYKFIDAPRKEFYDLQKDPGEESDVKQQRGEMAAFFQKTLKNVVTESSKGAPEAHSANLDSETVERLAALGYIGAPVQRKPGATNELIDPKDRLAVHEAINQAGELSNNDHYQESAAVLEKVLHDDPENPQARLQLARDYVELKRMEEAKVLLEKVLQDDPGSIPALISLANILQDEGKSDQVILLCKNVLKEDERSTQALTMMGQAYMDLRDFASALPWIQKAVEVQPKLTQNQLSLATCYIGLKKYDDAQSILNKIIETTPKFPKAHYHLGLLYEEQGKIVEACREYEKEIEIYPNSFMARFNLGRLKLRQGDQAEYMKQMEEVVRLAPKNAAGYLFLARGKLQQNANTDEILSLTEKGLEFARTPEHKAMAYFLLADIYNRRNQPQLVREALTNANQYKSQIH
jgi:arylsulfatase A-like enzyme/tetratricopeptide (TPR) repeat protein